MAGNFLNLTKTYTKGVFKPLVSLLILDIKHNMPKITLSRTSYPYFGDLRNLSSLSLDLVSRPDFATSGLERLTNLRKLVFDHCGIEQLYNETLLYISPNIEEVYFRRCTAIRVVDANFLNPLTSLQIFSLYHSNVDLSSALTLLYPFKGKRMKTIEITRVNPGYEFVGGTTKAVIVTRGMMIYLQSTCVSTLILAENGIVDFEPKSILFHNYPHCFENIVLTGNRFSFIDGFKLKELMTLSRQLLNLTLFDFSYNPLLYENIKYPIKLPHEYLLESFTDRDLKTYEQGIAFNNTTGPMHEVLSENTVFFSLPPKLKKLRLTNYLSDQRSTKHIIFMNASNLRHLDVSYFDENNFPKISVHGPFNIDYIDFSGITSWRKSIELFKNSKTVVLNNLNISPLAQRHEHFFSFIPEVEKLDISANNLWQLRKDTFSRNKKLTSLIITHNLFSELPTALTEIPKLTYLDARINIIDTINKTMRNWFDKRQTESGSFHLLLHGNVFRCTCETIDFIQWISTTKVTGTSYASKKTFSNTNYEEKEENQS